MFFWQSVHSNAKKSYQRYLWSTSWYLGIDRKSDFANLKGRDLWSLCCLLLPIASPNQTYRQKSSQEQVQRYTDVSIISTYAIYILYSERRVLQSKRDPTCFMFPFRSLALFAYKQSEVCCLSLINQPQASNPSRYPSLLKSLQLPGEKASISSFGRCDTHPPFQPRLTRFMLLISMES